MEFLSSQTVISNIAVLNILIIDRIKKIHRSFPSLKSTSSEQFLIYEKLAPENKFDVLICLKRISLVHVYLSVVNCCHVTFFK